MIAKGPVGRVLRLAGLVLLCSLALAPGARADFGEGLAAYDGGDYRAALKAWRPLALAGDAEAQVALASLYADGLGVARDEAEAARWYRRAAERGDAVAQLNLGEFFAKGSGVPRDVVRAYFWLSLAAAQGRVWPALLRDELGAGMTPAQVAEAEGLIEAWRPSRP